MAVKYPHDNPDSWDTLITGKLIWPGTVIAATPSVSLDFEITKRRNKLGGRIKPLGMQPRSLVYTIQISTEEEWDEIQKILPQTPLVNPSVATQPMQISHPLAKSMGIDSVYFKNLSTSYPDAGEGWFVTLGFMENLKPEFITEDTAKQKAGSKKKKKKSLGTAARDLLTGAADGLGGFN